MTKSERKRIPDLDSREAKGKATMLSFEVGMREVLTPEEERRDLEGT